MPWLPGVPILALWRDQRHRGAQLRHTAVMQFPTPEDPKRAPIWENYVVAEAAQAALRRIPPEAFAMGVRVAGPSVVLVVQAAREAVATSEDVADIVSELEALLGPDVEVAARADVRDAVHLNPEDGVRWFFAARA